MGNFSFVNSIHWFRLFTARVRGRVWLWAIMISHHCMMQIDICTVRTGGTGLNINILLISLLILFFSYNVYSLYLFIIFAQTYRQIRPHELSLTPLVGSYLAERCPLFLFL